MRVGTECTAQLAYLEISWSAPAARRGPPALIQLKRIRDVLRARRRQRPAPSPRGGMVEARKTTAMSPEHGAPPLLRGGTVIDGIGALRSLQMCVSKASVVGSATAADACRVIDVQDARGAGFTDVHTHDDQIVSPRCCRRSARRYHRRRRQLRHQPRAARACRLAPATNPLGGGDSTFIRRWRLWTPSAGRGPWSTSRRSTFQRGVATMDDPYVPPRLQSRHAWSSCCAKGWMPVRQA